MSDASGQTAWAYSADGQVTTERRTIAGITKTISYAYNLNGSVSQIYYPSGMMVTNFYDLGGQVRHVACMTVCNPLYFAGNATYAPPGALASVVLGSGGGAITVTNTYNKRLQPVNMKATHTNGKLYWYGVQGEVLAESDLSGTILYDYIYFNGKRIARRTPSGTSQSHVLSITSDPNPKPDALQSGMADSKKGTRKMP